VEEAEYYLVSYGLESGKYLWGVPNVGRVTSFRISGLDMNQKYYFQVRSHKGCAPSEGSNELSYPHDVTGQVLGLADTGEHDGRIALVLGLLVSMGLTLIGMRMVQDRAYAA
jgi:hypothetical protein